MGTIQLDGVEKWFGEVQVIKGVDLAVADGELVIFVGPSGCGKSTLLRLISGLEEATLGDIIIDGRNVTGLPPAQRGMAMVFQSYALYPHMSVRDNIGFPLKMAGVPADKVRAKVDEAAAILKLEEYLERKPKALSGGQRQRVAIGRAIVRDPSAFAFDEPLSNLDAALRVEMRFEIAKLHQQLGATMIYVTHDQVEAMTLADRIVVLEGGRVEQIGAPLDLYESPDNLFVAQFIGSPKMNLMDCGPAEGGVSVAGASIPTRPIDRSAGGGAPVTLGVRPEHIAVSGPGEGQLTGLVEVSEHLGSDTFLYVTVEGVGTLTVRSPGHVRVKAGEQVGLSVESGREHLFDRAGLALRH